MSAPHSIEAITAAVITDLLEDVLGSDIVRGVTATPVGAGQMADSYRLSLDYESGTNSGPSSLVVKLPSAEESSRSTAAWTGAYTREVRFYQRLAGLVDMRTPGCYFSDVTDDGTEFILVLEDVSPSRNIDQIAGCGADDADTALAQAAALHGPSWGQQWLKSESWLSLEDVGSLLCMSVPSAIDPWLERFSQFLEPEHISVIVRLGQEVGSWLPSLSDHRSLWHADYRLDNLLFEPTSTPSAIMTVIDWQSVAAAPGIIDVSYFLGSSMTEENRLKHERHLVREYHRRLLAYGVQGYSAEDCWREYRAHAVYGLIMGIPISLGVQATPRGDAMFGVMAARAAAQILANDSFDALASL